MGLLSHLRRRRRRQGQEREELHAGNGSGVPVRACGGRGCVVAWLREQRAENLNFLASSWPLLWPGPRLH